MCLSLMQADGQLRSLIDRMRGFRTPLLVQLNDLAEALLVADKSYFKLLKPALCLAFRISEVLPRLQVVVVVVVGGGGGGGVGGVGVGVAKCGVHVCMWLCVTSSS